MAETIFSINPFLIAFAGGILPALVWLWFWLHQDRENPEPRGLITLSFVAGMAVVFFVLPVQKLIVILMPFIMDGVDFLTTKFALIPPLEETVQAVLWSFTEEFGVFATVFLVAYHTRHFNEPVDAIMYLITAALGFAAMENTLYILKDLSSGSGLLALFDSNFRFIGATTLHIVSAAILGVAFAFAFYSKFWIQFIAGLVGITLATLLHAYFNLSIMNAYGTFSTLAVFAPFWGAIIGIIILIEVVKHIKKPNKITL